ncbi:uncharacterized protein LOC142994604 [Genypterus blacodes]|uniref:uncharacterized protein LOC142994604 n=1 Tax=Genypterus blacodes TaxID=154954 RepID=UPI003F7573A9
MVQWQLITLEHLMNSGFGRPFPRHGLQLLFWFANSCVSCEVNNFVIVMKLVSDCQPEQGSYGFHPFGNIEELLPVLTRSKTRKRKKVYFEVGNLNAETYPGSANLPSYVRENYESDGYHSDYNTDRIIISYQVRTKEVETVYITEHDTAVLGMFSPDRTHEISPELIQALQSPQLDLTTFLIKMAYSEPMWEPVEDAAETIYSWVNSWEDSLPQHMFNIVQSNSGSAARLHSQGFNQQIDVNIAPCRYDRHNVVNSYSQYSQYSQPLGYYSAHQHEYRRFEDIERPRSLPERLGFAAWLQPDEGSDEESKKWKKRGNIFLKLLLGVGVVYLAVKSISWLRSCGETGTKDLKQNYFRNAPVFQHIMLDYVY